MSLEGSYFHLLVGSVMLSCKSHVHLQNLVVASGFTTVSVGGQCFFFFIKHMVYEMMVTKIVLFYVIKAVCLLLRLRRGHALLPIH